LNKDIYFIKETFKLARKAEGCTSPNPLVGAIIVKNNRIIARGYHKRAGLPHAEIEAIRKAKEDLKGATLYVNLEPCSHFGKTPPCVDDIIRSGIKRVVIATYDPNPIVGGKSVKKLRMRGIKVKVGLLRAEAERLNEVFFKNVSQGAPFVVAKVAQSLDGKIATRKGESKWITSKEAREFSKSLRDKYDAVLVGINTVVKDNPDLNGIKKVPFKIVIDPHLRISPHSNLVKKYSGKLIVFASLKSIKQVKKGLRGVRVFFLKGRGGHFSLKALLKVLYKLGITSVFVEGGAFTLGRFFDERLVDKAYFFISPLIIGGLGALTSIGAKGYSQIKECPYLREVNLLTFKKDILISGYPCYKSKPLRESYTSTVSSSMAFS
jgi:diaminohydroxyphosphoribosylaminopyrimidine deaminase/5-amino-6-(5-phosphoribosylamino)uracil reductase